MNYLTGRGGKKKSSRRMKGKGGGGGRGKMTLLFICLFVTELGTKRRTKKTSSAAPGSPRHSPRGTSYHGSNKVNNSFFSDAHFSVAAGKSCLPLAAGAVAHLAGGGVWEGGGGGCCGRNLRHWHAVPAPRTPGKTLPNDLWEFALVAHLCD